MSTLLPAGYFVSFRTGWRSLAGTSIRAVRAGHAGASPILRRRKVERMPSCRSQNNVMAATPTSIGDFATCIVVRAMQATNMIGKIAGGHSRAGIFSKRRLCADDCDAQRRRYRRQADMASNSGNANILKRRPESIVVIGDYVRKLSCGRRRTRRYLPLFVVAIRRSTESNRPPA